MSVSGKAHVAAALRWQNDAHVEPAAVLAAAIGMAGPVALGVATGHLRLGLVAAVGGLAVGGASLGPSVKAQARELGAALVPAAVAAAVAAIVAGRGALTDALLVPAACAAATAGGYGRPMAVATTRFILFLIVTINVAGNAPDRLGLPILIVAGALWAAFTSLALGSLARALSHVDPATSDGATAASCGTMAAGDGARAASGGATATGAQNLARWKNGLAAISGWQYALRLGICLTVAGVARSLWPEHHLYWIALTAALLCERRIEMLPIKTTQRAFGTAIGVIAAYAFVVFNVSTWGVACVIGLLAGLRTLLRARNYLAYAVTMTPLIILMMDAGRPLGTGVLIDRLVATLVGASLVISVNAVVGAASSATQRAPFAGT
jgi:hypothetical protein